MKVNPRRIAILVAIAALASSAALLASPSPAQAHNDLVSSTPAAGEILTELPEQFAITTNEPLLAIGGTGGFALQIRDAAGLYYGDGCVAVAGASMTATPALGAPGTYTILWQVVSEDGHSVSDDYTFTWAPVGESVSSQDSATPPDCHGTAQVSAPNPEGTAVAASRESKADLGQLLWIGGGIAALLLAALVTFIVLGRRRR